MIWYQNLEENTSEVCIFSVYVFLTQKICLHTQIYTIFAAECRSVPKSVEVRWFFYFCYFSLLDKISMESMILVPPSIDFPRKIVIFPSFEGLYLHDYWSDFKKFTHKTYLHTERRRFNIVSQCKNENNILFESSLCREILDLSKLRLTLPYI